MTAEPFWKLLQCLPVSFLNRLNCTSVPKFWGGENSAHQKDEIGTKGRTENHLPACLMQLRAPDRPYGLRRAERNLKKVWVWYLGRTRPTVTNFMAFLICVCMNISEVGGEEFVCAEKELTQKYRGRKPCLWCEAHCIISSERGEKAADAYITTRRHRKGCQMF